VHDHLVEAFLGSDDDRRDAGLDETVIGVEGVDCFRGIADDDEGFSDGFVLGGWS
jgi:hypothetical protein